jgi:signal peptidase I
MSNKKSGSLRRDVRVESPAGSEQPHASGFVVFRETVESIVVAFVLAFLFRTFEAEAFVIPTGSMSPSLLGQHKDVSCPHCDFRFRTTASSEGEDRDRMIAQLNRERGANADRLRERISDLDVVGGMCPMCRYLMPMRPDLPATVRNEIDAEDVDYQPSYPGDRILVNKYGVDFSEPDRWDVIVFKFPGDGNMNYIKRLVGLPGETLRVYQGDVFTKPLDAGDDAYHIERKPPDKVAAMLEIVHDTDYEPSALYNAGWPLRWAATTSGGWKVDAQPGEQTVEQRFTVDQTNEAPLAWLRYRHLIPSQDHWGHVREIEKAGGMEAAARAEGLSVEEARRVWREGAFPQLITDFNAYNARLLREFAYRHGWEIVPNTGQNSGSFGSEWVGDLAVDCNVEVEEARGELALDLVEAGYHFRATIDLKSGKAKLAIVDGRTGEPLEFSAEGDTGISSPGRYELRFANVDDQLLLWVDGELVDLGDAAYDPDKLMGQRSDMIPWRSEDEGGDQGDLAPAGVAARGAKLAVSRLAIYRDIYYIAVAYPQDSDHIVDYIPPRAPFEYEGQSYPGLRDMEELFLNAEAWPRFRTRQARDFPIEAGQLFVMGDNSPESKDCRLWMAGNAMTGTPGGQYLDRSLLIGKALTVFWPHSWGGIPGLPKLPGFPNFKDMRLVR